MLIFYFSRVKVINLEVIKIYEKEKVKRYIQNIPFLFLVVLIFGCSTSKRILSTDNPSVNIIPKPQILTVNKGTYKLPKANSISFEGSSILTAKLLKEFLQSKNLNVEIDNNTALANFKLLADLSFEKELGEEGYILDINDKGVTY